MLENNIFAFRKTMFEVAQVDGILAKKTQKSLALMRN